MAYVLSLNLGYLRAQSRQEGHPHRDRQEPRGQRQLRSPGPKHGGLGSGVVGDFVGDQRHHGGDHQAVYAYAREELDAWQERLGRELRSGMFGENLTTSGLDVDGAVGRAVAGRRRGGPRGGRPADPLQHLRGPDGGEGWVRRSPRSGTRAYLAWSPGTVRRRPSRVAAARHGSTCDSRSGPSPATQAAELCPRGRLPNEKDHAELAEVVRRRTRGSTAA